MAYVEGIFNDSFYAFIGSLHFGKALAPILEAQVALFDQYINGVSDETEVLQIPLDLSDQSEFSTNLFPIWMIFVGMMHIYLCAP